MRTYLRVTDGNSVKWIIEQRHANTRKYRIVSGDELVFAELSVPCTRRREIHALDARELLDRTHFESDFEQNVMTHAFAEMFGLTPSAWTTLDETTQVSFQRCINYCTGQEVY